MENDFLIKGSTVRVAHNIPVKLTKRDDGYFEGRIFGDDILVVEPTVRQLEKSLRMALMHYVDCLLYFGIKFEFVKETSEDQASQTPAL